MIREADSGRQSIWVLAFLSYSSSDSSTGASSRAMKKLVFPSILVVFLTAGATLAAFAPLGMEARAAAPTSSPTATPSHGKEQTPAAETASKDKREAAQRQLELAGTYARAGAWDQAIEAFSKAADSEDLATASKGRAGLLDALKEKDAGALGLRAKLPTPVNQWWVLDYVVYGLVGIVLAVIFVPIASFIDRVLFRPAFELVFKRDASRSAWRVSLSGSAEEPNKSVVFDEFVVTMRSLRESAPTVRALSSVGPAEARFFTPLSLAEMLGPDLVVRGIDVSQIAAIVQRFRDHFSYGFELRVDKLDDHAYAYASLRWGGRVERSWQIPSLTEGTQFGFREIGRQLAFVVYGDGLVRR